MQQKSFTVGGRLYPICMPLLLSSNKCNYFTRLNREFCSDLAWWHVFLQSWNGLSLLRSIPTKPQDFTIYTDASGSWGCGTCFGRQWLQWEWPPQWYPIQIMANEVVPVVFSCAVWDPQLARRTVLFRCDKSTVLFWCDKSSVVAAVKKALQRKPTWCTWLDVCGSAQHTMIYHYCMNTSPVSQTTLWTTHLTATCNLSFTRTRKLLQSTLVPPSLQRLLALPGPDWTSPTFRKLFKFTISEID